MATSFKTMSNSELALHKKRLEDEYDAVKGKIQEKLDRLKELENEYNNLVSEMNNRGNIYL